jgi:hypothetical protein
METPAARLEKKFKRKHRLIESDIGKTQKAALRQLLKEGRVVQVRAYYLAGHQPTLQSESERILQKLLSRPCLFRRTSLSSTYKESQPFFQSALTNLVTEKRVVRLGVSGTKSEYFIHGDHLLNLLDAGDPGSSKPAAVSGEGDNRKKLTARIYKAYERLARDKERRSVFISDLRRVSETSWDELRGWIEQEIVEKGRGQLDEGDWGAATEEQRAAAIELWGRKRLYIALVP